MRKNLIIALIFSLLSTLSFAQTTDDIDILSAKGMMEMNQGLKVHEALFDFFKEHPCELGLQANCQKPMSSSDISKMKALLLMLESWRAVTFDTILPLVDVLKGLETEIKLGDKHKVEEKTRFNPLTFAREKYLVITYNPQDPASRAFIQKIRIQSATHLLLFDSFFRLADTLSKAKKIRSILQHDMPEVGPFLNKTYGLAMERKRWDGTRHSIVVLDKEIKLKGQNEENPAEIFFNQYIQKSFIAERMRENDMQYRLAAVMMMDRQLSETKFFEAVNRIVGKLSQIFGNTAGSVQSRDGKLKVLAKDIKTMNAMKATLRPLDVLLEKTPFRLTDRFIPGYFGHVAIWLGSQAELQSMTVTHKGQVIPLLSHPSVVPHLSKISEGKMIVEALRIPGVTMNTLEHFMDIDDFLVIRRDNLDPAKIGEYVLKTIQQVGKPYDFNFDIETEREIVCSELVYVVFNDEYWPIERQFGRYTMSPDHVAWKGAENIYEMVMFYIDGKNLSNTDMADKLKDILKLPGGIVGSNDSFKY